METLFIYLLKASALIAAYFLAYHFLLRKETFFTTNRWYLLAGLITSAVMPLLFIKKVVLVEKPKMTFDNLAEYTTQMSIPVEQTIDWFQLTLFGYAIISAILFIKIITHLLSLFKLLHKKEVVKKERFSLVDLNENIAPFSFFRYIVYNSSFYTNDELHSILLHEKIHSQERHSIDVLLSKLFCIVFWFNPFMWLYKKAITQNLEYIADQKAIQHIEDKKVYQKALLKVVSHQNCLSITSPFYQSLIKKRIVMLNKNQSSKTNSWKYFVVLPLLAFFMFQFQVKVLAQEKSSSEFKHNAQSGEVVSVVIDKNSTDEEIKKDSERLKSDYGISLKVSKVKRNSQGEITGIRVQYKDKAGNTGVNQTQSDTPIQPIHFFKEINDNGKNAIGFGNPGRRNGPGRIERIKHFNNDDNEDVEVIVNTDFDMDDFGIPQPPDAPDAPEAPEALDALDAIDALEAPNAPEPPKAPRRSKKIQKNVIIKKNGNKEEVWVNGKKVTENIKGDFDFDFNFDDLDYAYTYDTKGPKGPKGPKGLKTIINGDEEIQMFNDNDGEITIITKNKNGKRKVERIDVRNQMENARIQMERARPAMENARIQMERARPAMERARRQSVEAQKEAMEAHKEAMEAHKEAMKEQEQAMKEAQKDREEALKEAQKDREEAQKEAQKARKEAEKNKTNR